jgi:hypothetical protein
VTVWREKDIPDRIREPLNREEFLLSANIPKAKGTVVTDRRESLAIGRKSKPPDALGMAFADPEEFSVVGVPQTNGVFSLCDGVGSGRENAAVVR